MTTEQLKELVEVLSVLSAKSSVIKERDELRALMEENQQAASEEAEVQLCSQSGRRARSVCCLLTANRSTHRTPKRRHL